MNKLLLSAVILSLSLLGCGRGEEVDGAEDADESTTVTSSESALTSELSDEVAQPMSATPENLASSAATRVGSHLQPASCLTTTVNGATVTYVMVDCTGPYGLVHVTGTLTAVYSHTAGVVQVVITGTGLKVNAAVIDVNATVKASQANGIKKADVVSNSTGTGPRGGSLSREGTYTVTYDPTAECVTLDGSWTTKVAARTGTTTVTGYKRCKGSCPAAGGTIVHTQGKLFTVTMTYDGSAVASWATGGGRSGTVNLKCGGS